MEISVEPDLYTPSIDDNGNYIDKVPSFNIIKNGIYCPCGSRKDKIYNTQAKFVSHIKTKTHNKWLESVNLNKSNYYIEALQNKEIINNQKLIIAKMDIEIQNKNRTIDYLTNQLSNLTIKPTNIIVENLIDLQ